MKSWIEHVRDYSKETGKSFKESMMDPKCKDSYKSQKVGGLIGPAIRRDYRPQIRELLKKVGDKKILNIVLQRVPIESTIRNALNILTLGTFEKQTQKLGYDKLFHLSMIVGLEGEKKPLVVEKNEVINISYNIPPMKKGGDRMIVPVKKSITLNEMLDNAQKVQGSNFFLYDAFKNNCQMFIRDLLKYSGLLTPQSEAFIYQDVKELVKGLPFYTEYLARGLTNLAGQWDRIYFGKGS